MATWQRRARLGIAAAGLAVAGAVYLGLQERAPRAPTPPVERFDPAALLETEGGSLQRIRGNELDFEVAFARSLSYRDGSIRQFDVRITVYRGEDRQYVITADRGEAGRGRVDLHLFGDVVLTASDGLVVRTDEASLNQEDGILLAPGRLTFSRGGLTGSGVGMRYDEARDRLEVAEQSDLRLVDTAGQPLVRFTAVSTVLDRPGDRLLLEGTVRADRGGQTLEADRADAWLSPADDAITRIELKGDARVAGGAASPGAMRAHEIDLDYGESGDAIERAMLRGAAMLVMAGAGGEPGRRLSSDTLDLEVAPDGSLRAVDGAGQVRLEMPPSAGVPAGRITARRMSATGGGAGRGLSEARFDDDVRYSEGGPGEDTRLVESRALDLTFADEGIGRALFSGDVGIDADGFRATSGQAGYDPAAGGLQLRRGAGADDPRVRDARMVVTAVAIDLGLDSGRLEARDRVRTTLEPGGAADGHRLPGLLRLDAPAQVTAAALDYDAEAGEARYRGAVVLWQGETTLRAETLRIDQGSGDLQATGSVRSTMPLENGRLDGLASELTYADATRLLTYRGSPDIPAAGGGVPLRAEAGDLAQLVGPAGDLRARRIVVVLGEDDGQVERIDADTDVHVDTGGRRATGAHLVYRAADERYELTGRRGAPVRVVDPCGETEGATLIFFTSTDRMVVDGHEQVRTRTTGRRTCEEAPAP